MDYPTCKTCKWHGSQANPKICGNPKINDTGAFFNTLGDDQLSYEYYDGGRFESGHNFGCVHHESKP